MADVARTGAQLSVPSGEWITPTHISSPLVVFVHGFTSHGGYMTDVANYASSSGFSAALFNYDSYLGIDRGAVALRERLLPLKERLKSFGYVIVGHSMGGLVAKCFAADGGDITVSLCGLALIGTPRHGFPAGARLVSFLLDWADAVTGVNPWARSPLCRASAQLTCSDPECLLDKIARGDSAPNWARLPILSISGGQPYLDFGSHPLVNATKNRLLQTLLDDRPNDGIVPESQSNYATATSIGVESGSRVHGAYSDWPLINHTYLIHNQEVARILIDWLRTTMKARET